MTNNLQDFKSSLDAKNSLIVAIPANPSEDVMSAALALYLSLNAYGKKTKVIASDPAVVRDSHLVGIDKVTNDVGGSNLVITFNLEEDAVEKVTSNTEGGHLNLIITPKKGLDSIKSEDISFGYSGAAADLVIVVGADSLSALGPIAEKEVELFESAEIINFGKNNSTFGSINLTDLVASNSELATAVIQELGLPLDIDIAGNLMQGIVSATDPLHSPDMTADTFEALAILYRAGARMSHRKSPEKAKIISDTPILDLEPSQPEKLDQGSPDWLKPKIFKSSSKNTG